MLLSDIYVTGDQRQHSGSEIFDEQTQIKESAFSRIFHPSRFLQKNKPVYLVFTDEPLSRLQYLIARWEDERDADTSAIHAISPSFAMSCASEWHHSPERSQTSCLQEEKKSNWWRFYLFFSPSHTHMDVIIVDARWDRQQGVNVPFVLFVIASCLFYSSLFFCCWPQTSNCREEDSDVARQ